MKLEISISQAQNFKQVHPQSGPKPQTLRWIESMARTVVANRDQLRSKVNRTLDSRSCYGLVAINLNSNVGRNPEKYQNDRILFFGDASSGYVTHCVMANDRALTYDSSQGELRLSPKGELQFWKYHTEGGDAGTWTHLDLIYYISVKDFYAKYVQPLVVSSLLGSASTSAATDILYHATSVYSAAKILTTDSFDLTPLTGTQAETDLVNQDPKSLTKTSHQVKRSYYLSMTRSKVGSFTRAKARGGMCVLNLDGRKLSQRYIVRPVDYWGTIELGSTELRDTRNEREDRLFHSRASIQRASSYVTSVHIYLPEDYQENNQLFQLWTKCKKLGIPVFGYLTEKQFLLQDRSKSVPVQFSKLAAKGPEPRPMRRPRKGYLAKWWELHVTPFNQRDRLSEDAQSALNYLRYDDGLNVFNADLHNAKTSRLGDPGSDRETLIKLVRAMDSMKLTAKGFAEKMKAKWWAT